MSNSNFPPSLLGFLRAALGGTPISPPPQTTSAEWLQFLDSARAHRILPLLYKQLKPVQHDFPSEIWKVFEDEYLEQILWSAVLVEASGRALQEISKAGVEPVVLKGIAFGETLYKNVALRPTTDLDLLVPHSNVRAVKQALLDAGFTDLGLHHEDLPMLHCESFLQSSLLNTSERFGIDVHWHLIQHPQILTQFTQEDWIGRAIPVNIAGVPVRVLCPEDAFIHVVSHLYWHHLGSWHLMWISDIDLLIRALGSSYDFAGLVARARRLRVLLPLQEGIRLARAWFATPISEHALIDIFRAQPDPIEINLVLDQHASRQNTWTLISRRSQAFSSWPQRLTYWVNLLFPPVSYMTSRYGVKFKMALPVFYIGRLLKGILWTSWHRWHKFSPEQSI